MFILAMLVYATFERCDLYGVSLCACGMLSNMATGLTIDAYGPVSDNAGNSLLIYICNFHVLSNLLLIYICKLHWNLNTMFVCQVIPF